jgi:hypothetical protein
MQMRVETSALPVVDRNQMHAVAAGAVTAGDYGEWPLGDSHWRHLVRRSTYNMAIKSGNAP